MVSTLIPYRNGPALASYYLGVFSIVPAVGLLLSVPAVVLGALGIRKYCRRPECKGLVHAIVGLVLGVVFGLAQIAVVALILRDAALI